MIIRLRDERRGERVYMRVFIGEDEDHLELCGALYLNIGEWQLFGAALLLGAQQTKGHLEVQHPDDLKIVEDNQILFISDMLKEFIKGGSR